MARSIVADIPYVTHLALVAISDPLNLLGAVLFDAMHLLGVILAQSFELLTFIILDIIQHLVNLFGARCYSDPPAAQTPPLTATPTELKEIGELFLLF